MKPLRRCAVFLLPAMVLLMQSGCAVVGLASAGASTVGLASTAVVQTTKVATKTTVAGGKVVGAAVTGGGRVATAGVDSSSRVSAATVTTAGDLTASSIRALGKLSQAGMVTFVDLASGQVVRVPWRAGLNVYGGSALANVRVAERALAVIRGGKLVYQTAKALAEARALPVKAGDVIRLADFVR